MTWREYLLHPLYVAVCFLSRWLFPTPLAKSSNFSQANVCDLIGRRQRVLARFSLHAAKGMELI